jgi:hypothetical protein
MEAAFDQGMETLDHLLRELGAFLRPFLDAQQGLPIAPYLSGLAAEDVPKSLSGREAVDPFQEEIGIGYGDPLTDGLVDQTEPLLEHPEQSRSLSLSLALLQALLQALLPALFPILLGPGVNSFGEHRAKLR